MQTDTVTPDTHRTGQADGSWRFVIDNPWGTD